MYKVDASIPFTVCHNQIKTHLDKLGIVLSEFSVRSLAVFYYKNEGKYSETKFNNLLSNLFKSICISCDYYYLLLTDDFFERVINAIRYVEHRQNWFDCFEDAICNYYNFKEPPETPVTKNEPHEPEYVIKYIKRAYHIDIMNIFEMQCDTVNDIDPKVVFNLSYMELIRLGMSDDEIIGYYYYVLSRHMDATILDMNGYLEEESNRIEYYNGKLEPNYEDTLSPDVWPD